MVKTRKAHNDEVRRIVAFYNANEYRPTIKPTDVLVVAENDGKLCGVVRLCEEKNCLILRGMRVLERVRRQGVGTQLLKTVELSIGDRECFCIPHRYLQSFYGQIGFAVIEESDAPLFLQGNGNRLAPMGYHL